MTEYWVRKVRAHRENLERYSRILATPLTDIEQAFVTRRIDEERAELEKLVLEPAAA